MRRLIEWIVRRGASGARLRASLPTTVEPSSRKDTTEGTKIFSPAPSRTISGLPSTTRATSEFVVPRSIPTISSCSLISHASSPIELDDGLVEFFVEVLEILERVELGPRL